MKVVTKRIHKQNNNRIIYIIYVNLYVFFVIYICARNILKKYRKSIVFLDIYDFFLIYCPSL